MEALITGGLGIILLVSILSISTFYPIFAIYLMPYAFALSPEIIVGGTPAREISVRLEDLLLAVLLIRIVFEFVMSKYFPPPKLYKGELFAPMFFYSASLIISTSVGVALFRVSPASGFFYVLKMIQFFLFFLICFYYINRERDAKIILTGLLVTMGIVTLIGMIQVPLGGRTTMPFEGEAAEPNTFGGYYVLLGSIVAGLYTHETKGWKKAIYGLLLAFAVLPFIYTMSRTSWISAVFSLMTFLLLTKGLQRKVVIVIVALLIAMSLPLMPGTVKERFQFWKAEEGFERTQTIGLTKFDPSSSERIEKYKQVPRLFVKSPLVGLGVTGGGFIDGQFIRVIVETGIIGILTFSYLFYVILKYLYVTYRRTTIQLIKGLALGLFCATIGLLVHGVGASTFMLVRIAQPYMLLLGLLISYNYLLEGKIPETSMAEHRYVYPYLITKSVN